MIMKALPVTIEMGALALFFSMLVAIPVGILSARRPNSPEDFLSTTFALLGVSTPNFWLGIMLVLVFTAWLGWLPAAGFVRFTESPWQNLKHMILPALTMSGEQMALTMRMTRSSFVEIYNEDFLTTARAKGLKESVILLKHAFRPAMIPVASVVGLSVGAVLSGAFIIETIFSVPGLGKLGVDAIFKRDFPVVQGVTLVTALMFLTLNLVVDFIYVYLDPRISHIGSTTQRG
jgi:peptide/nickel transport system permease protein